MKKNLLFGFCLLLASPIFSQNWHHKIRENRDAEKKRSEENIPFARSIHSEQYSSKKTVDLGELILKEDFTSTIKEFKSNPTQADFDAITSLPSWTGEGCTFYPPDLEMKGKASLRIENGWLSSPPLDLSANEGNFTLIIKAEAAYNKCQNLAVWVNNIKYTLIVDATGLSNFDKEYKIAISGGNANTKIHFTYDTVACESKSNDFWIAGIQVYQIADKETPEARYLGENFNKLTLSTFPPYAWLNIDNDGDGNSWSVSATADGYEQSSGAISFSWLFQYFTQDNWLVTPPLLVKDVSDSIKYWAGSFQGNPEYYEVRVSTTKPTVDQFTFLMDSLRFNSNIPDGVHRGFSLSQFLGDTVYVAFRHKFNGESERLCLVLDNIEGPEILPFKKDIGVEAILSPMGLECDLCDKSIIVVIQNFGTEAVENFSLNCQSAGSENGKDVFSDILTDKIQRRILPGDTIHHVFSSVLPLSTYDEGEYFVRSFLSFPEEQYAVNDTLSMMFYNQKSSTIPITNGFEQTDKDGKGWSFHTPPTSAMAAFSVGENPLFANKGNAYIASSVSSSFDTTVYPNRRGDDAFIATRCLKFENDNEYKINLFYAFRKFDMTAKEKKLNMRILIGNNPNTLLTEGEILIDTSLFWDRELVKNGVQAAYSLFGSNPFSVEQTGTYYIGFVFYSDNIVSESASEWMLFVDDISITKADAEQAVDLSLDKVILPYDCNLTENETISILIRNASAEAISNVNASYAIDNENKVEEIIKDTIHPNTQFIYNFTKFADLSQYKKYKVSASLSHSKDTILSNNEKSQITENKSTNQLPFYDGFEEIGTITNFEDAYYLISTGYYTWSAATDFSEDTAYAYKGITFLVDGTDNERYVASDDWIMGNCLEFIKDSTYELSFAYKLDRPSVKIANLKVALLSSYDTASVLEKFPALNNIQNVDYQIFKAEYTPSENHIAHFAMHSIGQIEAPLIMIDELRIAPKGYVNNEKTRENEIFVSPNPAKEFINISGNISIEKIELLNIVGNTVYTQNVNGSLSNHVVTVNHLPKGMYLLVLTSTEKQRISKKIIID